jgi:hypothetical protein
MRCLALLLIMAGTPLIDAGECRWGWDKLAHVRQRGGGRNGAQSPYEGRTGPSSLKATRAGLYEARRGLAWLLAFDGQKDRSPSCGVTPSA